MQRSKAGRSFGLELPLITLRKVYAKLYGYDKMYMDKVLIKINCTNYLIKLMKKKSIIEIFSTHYLTIYIAIL